MTSYRTRPRLALLGFMLATTTVVAVASSPTFAGAEEVTSCRRWEATLVGTDGDDVIDGTPGRDVIAGLGGNDVINGRGGGDIICGHAGDDILRGGAGGDLLFGGSGSDTLGGSRGNDRIWGNSGDDTIRGGIHSDVCVGESETNCEMDYRGPRDEQEWRDLVDQYFGDIGETDNALVIIACESNGDPFAVHPDGSVKGLWQYKDHIWDWMAPQAGWGNEVRVHPEAATATARAHYDWADAQTRQDGSDGMGFDPWTHCRCLIEEYDCPFDLTARDKAGV